jgi:hypothetical protein
VNDDWWHAPRFTLPPQRIRPDAVTCWVDGCGRTGREYRPGWLQCDHPEGPVQWYGGTRPLVLSNGTPVTR